MFKSVLVVEDCDITRDLMVGMLRVLGFLNIQVASTGAQGFVVLKKGPQIELVITDMLMPGMSGMQLVKLIRKQLCKRNLAIILYSAIVGISDLYEQSQRYKVKVLAKPYDILSFSKCIQELYVRYK